MQITINQKEYNTDTLPNDSLALIHKIIACETAIESNTIAKATFVERLTASLEDSNDE